LGQHVVADGETRTVDTIIRSEHRMIVAQQVVCLRHEVVVLPPAAAACHDHPVAQDGMIVP